MKTRIVIAGALLAAVCTSGADALLIDSYDEDIGNPSSYTAWVNAGVAEDISEAAGGTISGGHVYNITGMTASHSGYAKSWRGGVPANTMLNGYTYVQNGTASVSIGGLENGVTTDGYSTEIYGDMEGNTFTLQANQKYKLYLFGVGDANGQDTTFRFDEDGSGTIEPDEVRTTAGVLPAAENAHYVTYEFTTGADVAGYTLDFTYSNNAAEYAGWNGLVLVAVQEPVSSLGLITAFHGGLLIVLRRGTHYS